MFEYALLQEAQLDIEESLLWYKERSIVAAENFLAEVNAAIEQICEKPERGKKKYKEYFEFKLKKFPFTLVYSFNRVTKVVIISAVFHNKRDPRKKYRRQ